MLGGRPRSSACSTVFWLKELMCLKTVFEGFGFSWSNLPHIDVHLRFLECCCWAGGLAVGGRCSPRQAGSALEPHLPLISVRLEPRGKRRN